MTELAPVRVWQGIEAEDPPHRRHDYPELLAMAEELRDSRREKFPALVEAGRIDAGEAAAQLALFEQIAADWRWIVTGEGLCAQVSGGDSAKRDALDESLRTIAGIAGRRGAFDQDLAEQAQRVIALRWHLDRDRWPRTVFNARLTHLCRADAAGRRQQKEAA